MNDGRLVTGSSDAIKVYDPCDNYKCVISIEKTDNYFITLCHLDNDNIVSLSSKTIDVWSFSKDSYKCLHSIQNEFSSIIASLSDKGFATCSDNHTIMHIFNNNCTEIKTLYNKNSRIDSMFYIKNKNYLLTSTCIKSQYYLLVWSISTFQCITVFTNIHYINGYGYLELDDNKVIIGGEITINIINLNTMTKETISNKRLIKRISTFVKLRDNSSIICSCENGEYYLFNTKTHQFITTHKKNDTIIIEQLISINNNTLAMKNSLIVKLINY